MKAIIGGTGIDKSEYFRKHAKTVSTPFGDVEYMEKDGIILLPRHSKGHSVPPHRINYLANIEALSKLGVESVVAIYAVGSITEKVPFLSYGILSDYMDFSGRNITFFSDRVKHTDVSNPYDRELSKKLKKYLPEAAEDVVYVCTNGPRFETKAEVRAYGMLGGDVVGMTGGTEITLLREKGIRTAGVVYSINWGTGVRKDIEFPSDEKVEEMSLVVFNAALSALKD